MHPYIRALGGLLLASLMTVLNACTLDYDDWAQPVDNAVVSLPTDPYGEIDFFALDDFTSPTEDAVADAADYRGGVWDSALLPDDFPEPVTVAEEQFTLYDPQSQLLGGDPYEMWILSITVTASQWAALCDAFSDAGWRGGGTDLAVSRATEVDGAWLSTRHYAYVWSSDYDSGTWLYTVQIAVFPRSSPIFPAALSDLFPSFTAGYTPTGGSFFTDEDGIQHWTFGGVGRFIGVSEEMAFAYRQTLAEAGFTLTDRSANHWIATGQGAAASLCVEALFDADCHTLELLYTITPEEDPLSGTH